MKTYTIGARVFCDFHFGGKPKGTVIAINKPGNGKDISGEVVVRLTESIGAYKKGEELAISTYYAVPCAQKLPRDGCFVRISTMYQYVQP